MVAKRTRKTKEEPKQEENEPQTLETPEVAEDQRVPSDPDKFRPADVPPNPLTPYGKGEKTSSQP